MGTKILAIGAYLPEKILTNKDLEAIVDTSHDWIVQRTGIYERRIAADGEMTSDMACKALNVALAKSGLAPENLDAIIVATTTPDLKFPSTACIIQGKIGVKNAFAFDVQAVCSGFIYAMSIAEGLIQSGKIKTVAVIGADKMSSILNWRDRNTCVLFGDGAGCVILSASDEQSAIMDWKLESDGSLVDILKTDESNCVTMNGKGVFKYATSNMINTITALLDKNGLSAADLCAVIAHQANARIIEYVSDKLSLGIDKLPMTLKYHANTSAASIPLAMEDFFSKKQPRSGDIIALCAVGGGMTSAGMLIKL